MKMSIALVTNRPIMQQVQSNSSDKSSNAPQVTLRANAASARLQSDSVRRRSLNISHFNALQNAVSNLARIDDFNLEELGYGFFSDVFKATNKLTGKVLVLKRFKDTNTKMNVLREVQLMNRLSHPNILRFKGVCVQKGQLHALTEFINGGDLDQLAVNKNIPLSWKQRVHILLDVARGINYLHSVGIFHRDLSSKNCLIEIKTGKHGQAKYKGVIADLGLAEKIPTTEEDMGRLTSVGTPYIMAPEVLHGQPYNEKADVFSYGLIVCQVIARISYDPEELPRSEDFGLARELFQKMVNVTPPPGACADTSFPPPSNLLELAFDCCQLHPKARPSFKGIVANLEKQLQTYKQKKLRAQSLEVCKDAIKRCTTPVDTSPGRRGIIGRGTGVPPVGSEIVLRPKKPRRTRLSSAGSRLSRSFSDISMELLSHAANMVATSHDERDDLLKGDVFSNPFSALDHLNGGQIKLTDEPSRALLEMTFDLAVSDSLKMSWTHKTNSLPRKKRPNSTFIAENCLSSNLPHSPLHSPFLTRKLHLEELDGVSSTPRSAGSPVSELPHHSSHECDHPGQQHALSRAMILSPRGNKLATWWHSRNRAEGEMNAMNERQSLVSVMSVLSRKAHVMRRCISLPDLSCVNALFQPAENICPRSKRRSESSCGERTPRRSMRSRTSEEIFAESMSRDSIAEEDESEHSDDADQITLHVSVSNQSSTEEATCSRLATPQHCDVFLPNNRSALSDNSNLNTIKETNLNTSEPTCIIPAPSIGGSDSPGNNSDVDQGHKLKETVDAGATSEEQLEVKNSTRTLSSTSSTSSGCSSGDLLMSLQSGELTQRKRRSISDVIKRSELKEKEENNSSNNNHGSSDDVTHAISPVINHESVTTRKFVNRDSGYEETLSTDDNTHYVASKINHNDISNNNIHVTWDIPEELALVTQPCTPITCPVPPSGSNLRIGSCGLGYGLHRASADWNDNAARLIDYGQHDAV